MDKYTVLKNELAQLIAKKTDLDQQLLELEDQIYTKENEYFNESTYGNIVKGFDSFAKTLVVNKRKMVYTNDDHIFSLLLATFERTLQRRQGVEIPQDYDELMDSVDPPEQSG